MMNVVGHLAIGQSSRRKEAAMSFLAKSKGEVTYKDLSGVHKWFLIILVSMGSSIIYTPIYLKNVFYEPLMQGLGCTNADLGALLSCYAITALITYLPAGILADKVRMRTLSWLGFGGTAVLTFIYAMLPSLGMLYALFVGFGITSILIWWGTRFKIVRLCCAEDEYASKIGTSYSIYGAAGLIIGLINAAIVSLIPVPAQGIQVLLVFLGVLIAILAVLVKEHPQLGDLPLLVTDQDCLQDRQITSIPGATKLVRHDYLRLIDPLNNSHRPAPCVPDP